jgi:cell division inhibitor SepF
MGFMDMLRDLVGIEEVEDDDEEIVSKGEEKRDRDISFANPRPAPVQSYAPSAQKEAGKSDNSRTMGRTTVDLKMIVVEPQGFDECPKLVDNLKAKKPVVINLENLETDVARKIFDFLSGATYALNGNVQKIANNIFVFAPANVDITYNATQKARTAETPVRSPWR